MLHSSHRTHCVGCCRDTPFREKDECAVVAQVRNPEPAEGSSQGVFPKGTLAVTEDTLLFLPYVRTPCRSDEMLLSFNRNFLFSYRSLVLKYIII